MHYRTDQAGSRGREQDNESNSLTARAPHKIGACEGESFIRHLDRISRYQKILVLTDGCSNPSLAKTAISLLRYRLDDIVAVLDASHSAKTTQEVFGVGGKTSIVGSVAEAPHADALFLGIAPAGGTLPKKWKPIILDAICRGLDVVSGLHEFLTKEKEFVSAAQASGCQLIDIRRNDYQEIATSSGFDSRCLRILTVGQDCSVGKMTAALEIEKHLLQQGNDAKFLATGQTGIMIRGAGVPIDAVVGDFISGTVEQLVLAHQNHEVVLVEGQGSITHPSFSGVTLGLLHGSAPHGMILCYEVGRDSVKGLPKVPSTPLSVLKHLYEVNAAVRHPSRVIAVAMNSRYVSSQRAEEERGLVEAELGVPVCDVFRHGPQVLGDAILDLKFQLAMTNQISRNTGSSPLRTVQN